MVEESILPVDLLSASEPAFPVGKTFSHIKPPGEGDDSVKVIRHREDQLPRPVTAILPESKGIKDRLPNFRSCKMVPASGGAIDRYEKRFLCGINPVGHIMR
jgi:hypothetical protein